MIYNNVERRWKVDPNDDRGFSFEDWSEMKVLKDTNPNFKNYYGFQNVRYTRFDHDFFMFGFFLFDDLTKDQEARDALRLKEKELQDEKIRQLEQDLATKSLEVNQLRLEFDALLAQLGVNSNALADAIELTKAIEQPSTDDTAQPSANDDTKPSTDDIAKPSTDGN